MKMIQSLDQYEFFVAKSQQIAKGAKDSYFF